MKNILVIFLFIFGGLTVFMGSSVIFDWFGIRKIEGSYVNFVVKANIFCGIIYLLAARDIWQGKKIGSYSLFAALIILIITFVFFIIHIKQGGLYEPKTIKAMSFRTAITLIAAFLSFRIYKKNNNQTDY